MSEERSVLDYLVAYAYAEIDAAIRNALADDDTPSDTALVAAFVARELDDDTRERAISSLRWACDEDDWLACAAQANALGVEEL